jgi:uncharacterized protein Yka (UPF0111/DUF47 family)
MFRTIRKLHECEFGEHECDILHSKNTRVLFSVYHNATICLEIMILMAISSLKNEC